MAQAVFAKEFWRGHACMARSIGLGREAKGHKSLLVTREFSVRGASSQGVYPRQGRRLTCFVASNMPSRGP